MMPMLQPMGKHVGILGAEWSFPTDHIPIGVEITCENNNKLVISSANVLNRIFFFPFLYDDDSQGLVGSQISDRDTKDGLLQKDNRNPILTDRDQDIVSLLIASLAGKDKPKDIFALQECSLQFLDHLKENLPGKFSIVVSDLQEDTSFIRDGEKIELRLSQNRNAIIYRNDLLALDKGQSDFLPKVCEEGGTFLDAHFKTEDGTSFQVVNCHLPGRPGNPAPDELLQYMKTRKADYIIAVGDMNFNEIEMKTACEKAEHPYQLYAPYPTNISPKSFPVNPLGSKSIDHIIIHGKAEIQPIDPEDVLVGAQEALNLLRTKT